MSAFWQLVAVVMGQKAMQSGKKTTQNCQNQPKIKGKTRLISKDIFLVAVVLELFSYVWYILYMYICIIRIWSISDRIRNHVTEGWVNKSEGRQISTEGSEIQNKSSFLALSSFQGATKVSSPQSSILRDQKKLSSFQETGSLLRKTGIPIWETGSFIRGKGFTIQETRSPIW